LEKFDPWPRVELFQKSPSSFWTEHRTGGNLVKSQLRGNFSEGTFPVYFGCKGAKGFWVLVGKVQVQVLATGLRQVLTNHLKGSLEAEGEEPDETASRQRSTILWAKPLKRKRPMRLIRARFCKERMTSGMKFRYLIV